MEKAQVNEKVHKPRSSRDMSISTQELQKSPSYKSRLSLNVVVQNVEESE